MKKRKLNSKNPKYLNNTTKDKLCIIKQVKGKAAIRNSSGNIVGKTTIRGIWYEQA